MREGRWLNVAALVTWLFCSLPQSVAIAQGAFSGWPAVLWVAAYLLYGAALLVLLGLAGPRWLRARDSRPGLLVAVQIAAAFTVIALSLVYRYGSNSTPALLVIVAAILPYLTRSNARPEGAPPQATLARTRIWSIVAALTVTNALLVVLVDPRWTAALTFGLTMGGFMLFAAASSFLVQSEAAARAELGAVNTELLGTRAQLAENSRAEERLRISRDLHDTLGHHLTALSLQLDVAARLTDGESADHIHQAHAITRLLLGDVRDVVSRLRETGRLDVAQAIRSLAFEQTGVAVHLDLPTSLVVDDASRAETLLRCVQEIMTNTTRHAHARNLWIRLELKPDGIALHARDDGRGADVVAYGNGLTGMQERFKLHAGRIEVSAERGMGFEIRGFLPASALA
jgi:signal transduction histidine kinase